MDDIQLQGANAILTESRPNFFLIMLDYPRCMTASLIYTLQWTILFHHNAHKLGSVNPTTTTCEGERPSECFFPENTKAQFGTSAFTKLSQSKSHLVMAMDLQINLYSLNLLSSPCPFMQKKNFQAK
jgi:hypothetical protein